MQKDFYAEYFQVEDKHWWFVGRRNILLGLLQQYLASDKVSDRMILDVGCGTGTMLGHLARFGQAQGVDSDEEAIRFCHMRGVHNVAHMKTGELLFPDGKFDVVTMFDVLEHIDDDAGTMREVARVLKPDGLFVVTVPAYDFLWGPQDVVSLHKRRYLAGELKRRLAHCGFEVKRLSYFNSILFPAVALIRLLRHLVPKRMQSAPKSDFTLTRAGAVNTLLGKVFSFERGILQRCYIPFGVSIVAVASKNGSKLASRAPAMAAASSG